MPVRFGPARVLDASFRVEALEEAMERYGTSEIFNTDQGSQLTSFAFSGRLQAAGDRIWMDGRGRCMDNIVIERLWRSLKCEAIDLLQNTDGFKARRLIADWVRSCNAERTRSELDGRTPAEAYRGRPSGDMMDETLRASTTPPQVQRQQQEVRFNLPTQRPRRSGRVDV